MSSFIWPIGRACDGDWRYQLSHLILFHLFHRIFLIRGKIQLLSGMYTQLGGGRCKTFRGVIVLRLLIVSIFSLLEQLQKLLYFVI
jgi:hypothetical protein